MVPRCGPNSDYPGVDGAAEVTEAVLEAEVTEGAAECSTAADGSEDGKVQEVESPAA
jgi:hypothetical protein